MLNWLNKDWTIKRFQNGEWESYPCPLAFEKGTCLTLPDCAVIKIKATSEETTRSEHERMTTIEVEAHPGSNGEISGVLLELPLQPYVRCTWKPHLSPLENMVIGDKVFRSPAVILEDESRLYALIPDLEVIQQHRVIPHVMDYDRNNNVLLYGVSEYEATGHVYHELTPRPTRINGSLLIRFYLVEWIKPDKTELRDFRPMERFLWNRFAANPMADERRLPQLNKLEDYVKHTYGWAFDRWGDICWQQFSLAGEEVGGVVFIVTAKQKPGMGKEDHWREPKSLWNQAWFSSLRSAYGYWLWGRKWGREDLMDKADMVLAFALSAPQQNGLFPGYFEAGSDNKWETGRWVMSPPRRPSGLDGYVHLLDASWTCFWLLKWYRDIHQDERILSYVRNYAERLITLQQENGNFPAWVHPESLECSPILMESPETAIHVMLLCLLHSLEPNPVYVSVSEKAARYIINPIMAEGRWEDFETYWSCAKEWEHKQFGRVDERSGLYNQCNFGMYWSAEALKEMYRLTGSTLYMEAGERVLAELSLYQQIWEPHYFPVSTLGGFGVMNSDDEWNDARQSLFALTYMDYWRLTGNETYRFRALWAMSASFYMMYCPENKELKQLYEQVHPHFDEREYGFHMENFNHHDGTLVNGLGEFTIFDWGNGAAASSLAEMLGLHMR